MIMNQTANTYRISRLNLATRTFLGIVLCHVLLPFTNQQAHGQNPYNPYDPGPITTKDESGNIVSLSFSATDEELESYDFSRYPHLRSFSINSKYVTNRGLAQLRKLPPGLLLLWLADAKIDDKELAPILQRLKSQSYLSLNGIEIGERPFSEIGNLADLRFLDLRNTKFDDPSLSRLSKLEGLANLNLSETGLTDRGMKEVGKLKGLIILRLAKTKITDNWLRSLADLDALSWLDLSHTKVTDDGILNLGGLSNLQKLNVSNTKVTENGKGALKALLPDLEFVSEAPLRPRFSDKNIFGK